MSDLNDLLDFGEDDGESLEGLIDTGGISEDDGESLEGLIDTEDSLEDLLDIDPEEAVTEEPIEKEEPVKAKEEKPAKPKKEKPVKTKKEKPARIKKEKAAKPKKEKPVKAKKEKKPLGKKKFLFLLLIPIVLVLLVGLRLMTAKGGTNYWTGWSRIFKNDAGHFTYVIDVRTKDAEGDKSTQSTLSLEDTKSLDSVEEPVESTDSNNADESKSEEAEATEKPIENASWSGSDGAVITDNEYPNYKVIIDGYTIKSKPYTSKYTMSIATDEFSGKFTEFVSVEDKLFVNVEMMYKWLSDSKDAYLTKLANTIPENSKYMELPIDGLSINSGYAEESELGNGAITTYPDLVKRFKSIILGITSSAKNTLGKTGLSSKGDDYSLSLTGNDANKVISMLKSITGNYGDFYDSITSQLGGTKEQQKQLSNEKDNFIAAGETLKQKLSDGTKDLTVQGKTRLYKSDKGIDNVESILSATFINGGKDYAITVQASLEGSGEEVTKPEGVSSEIDQSLVWGTLRDTAEYFNITGIALNKKLAVNTESIQASIMDEFVKYINANSNTKINALNAKDFLTKYSEFEVKDDTQEVDKNNVKLVQEFKASLTAITGNTIVESDGSGNNKFATVNADIEDDLRVLAVWNEAESKDKLGVVDVSLISSKGNKSVDLRKFSLVNAVNSKYPANSDTLLNGSNISYKGTLKGEVAVSAGVQDNKLYFVCSNGVESMALYYDGKKLGDIVIRK